MKVRTTVLFVTLAVLGILACTQVTLFVIQPIGAIPEGRTLLIWRTGKLKFIDSADAVCERESGGVNLLCRGAVLAAIAKKDDSILLRLPYSETLYLASTNGKIYGR